MQSALHTPAYRASTAALVSAKVIPTEQRGGWNGGSLKVKIAAHSIEGDQLTLPPHQGIWLEKTTLMHGQLPIGTANHSQVCGDQEWVFTFNLHTTTEMVQTTAQAITLVSHDIHGTQPARTVTFVATNAAATFAITHTVTLGTPQLPAPLGVLEGINDYIDGCGYRI